MRVVKYLVEDIWYIVPQKLRDKVVSENHDAIYIFWTFLSKENVQRLKQYFYWPGMSFMVFKKCESRLTCATTQGQERRQNPELHSIPVGEPFECIGIDFKKLMKVMIKIDLHWYFRTTYQSGQKFML